MQWLDDLATNTAYYTKLGLYNVGLRSTPPIVMPVDSIPASKEIKKQADRLEKDYGYGEQFKNSLEQLTKWLKDKLVILVVIAAILFFGYVFIKTKAAKLAN